MTNYPSPGVGSNGTAYSKYSYPGLYTPADFHPACTVNNYQDAANVQDCELFSLPDLHTGLASVRQKLADYLLMLARLGVAGFRIDAAKHIQQAELDSIVGKVNRTLSAEGKPLPYFFLEVVGGAGEALGPRDYYGIGYASGGAVDITEFTFTGVQDKFRRVGVQKLADLDPNGPPGAQFSAFAWGMMPGDKAVVFLQNHDTQHQGSIGYRDGDVFRLGNVWMLAQPYGYPSVLSSYAFGDNVMGPPSDANGNTNNVSCAAKMETATIGQWVCEHRDPALARMVRFRKVVAGTEVTRWWSNGGNAVAFSRGSKGFVAINREATTVSAQVTTSLAAGTYCDRLTGGRVAGTGTCAGRSLQVAADGSVSLELASNTAVAIDLETLVPPR
jgi:alpha-amylase